MKLYAKNVMMMTRETILLQKKSPKLNQLFVYGLDDF